MMDNEKIKPLPHFTTDEEAQKFTDQADLSEYALSGFKPMDSFAFTQKKDARIEMLISQAELDALKAEAEKRGIPHSRLARVFIEQGIRTLSPT